MTPEKIQQGNKLIAEFMGASAPVLDKNVLAFILSKQRFPDKMYRCKPEDLKYHSSWNWLMPVVEKIANTSPDHEVKIEIGKTFATFKIWDLDTGHHLYGINEYSDADKPMEAIYKGVLKFITWYNKQS